MLIHCGPELNPEIANVSHCRVSAYQKFVEGDFDVAAYPDHHLRLYEGSIAELLLEFPSTAIEHIPHPDADYADVYNDRTSTVLLAANYHMGHSEGHHKIVFQDPSRWDDGQWLLWIPPGSAQTRVFRRSKLFVDEVHEFEPVEANPLKILHHWLHIGSPSEAVDSFEQAGFDFDSTVLYRDFGKRTPRAIEYDRLDRLSSQARVRWDPSDSIAAVQSRTRGQSEMDLD